MKNLYGLFAALLFLTPMTAFSQGHIQNEDVKSLSDIESANGTITGNLTISTACISSPSSTAGLAVGQYTYDFTTPANIPASTTITGLPGSCSSGQIQLSNNATANATGDTIWFGGQASQLINDTKVYVTANGINDQLSNAITNGQLGGSGGGAGSVELLSNPGFESGGVTQGWSTTGGTATTVTSGSNLLYGKKTASWQASASSQMFESSALSINGLAGGSCSGQIYYLYSGSNGDYQLQVEDRSSNVLASVALPASTNASVPETITFPCGSSSSSTVQWQLVSEVSSPSTIYFDNAHLGSLASYQVSQAQLLGTVSFSCSSQWGTTATSFTNFSPASGCSCVATGSAQCPATTGKNGITFASLSSGEYKIEEVGAFQAPNLSNAVGQFIFSDGVNITRDIATIGGQGYGGGGYVAQFPMVSLTMVYTTAQSNVTLQLQGRIPGGDGTAATYAGFGNVNTPQVIRVYYYPASSRIATTPDLTPVNWSGYQTVGSGWTNSGGSYGDFSTGSSIVLTPLTNTNAGSPATNASGYPGIDFYFGKASVYHVCADVPWANSSNQSNYFRLVDESTNIINPGVTLYNSGTSVYTSHLCGDYNVPSVGLHTVKLQGLTTGGTITISAGSNSPLVWSIYDKNAPQPAPLLQNAVTSSSAGVEHLERISFGGNSSLTANCSSSPCTIASQSGWASSVTRSSTGTYSIIVNSGVFSAVPTCVQSGDVTGSDDFCRYNYSGSTTTDLEVNAESAGGSNVDGICHLICVGPH